MKRKDIIERLLFEGFTEKTLARLSDKQLETLSNTIIKEGVIKVPSGDTATQQSLMRAKKTFEVYEDDAKIPNKDEIASKLDSIRSGAKRDDMMKQGAYDGRFRERTVKDKKKEESKYGARGKKSYELDEEKPSAGLSKEKKSEIVKKAKKGEDIGKEGKSFKDVESKAKKSGAKDPKAVAAAAMWKGIKREGVNEWVMGLTESKFSTFTSKSDILSVINEKIKESFIPMPATKAKKGHNGVPEFMTYDSIVGNQPETKPNEPEVIPDAPPTEKPVKPKTPYEPGPGKDPKPKAMGEEKNKK